jgi:hypothetical protein
MSRYFIRPKMAAWTAPCETEIEEAKPANVTVWPDDSRDTGLLDADGNPIMASDRAPLGFLGGEE